MPLYTVDEKKHGNVETEGNLSDLSESGVSQRRKGWDVVNRESLTTFSRAKALAKDQIQLDFVCLHQELTIQLACLEWHFSCNNFPQLFPSNYS